jgi:hypothetical protein
MVPSAFRRIAHLCFIHQLSKKWHGLASTASSGRVSDISEKLDFWWSIPQKGTGIGHLGARDDQIFRISKFFFWWNEAVEVIKAIAAVEAAEVIEAAEVLRPGKPLLRTSESSRHLNSALFLYLKKKCERPCSTIGYYQNHMIIFSLNYLHLSPTAEWLCSFCARLYVLSAQQPE